MKRYRHAVAALVLRPTNVCSPTTCKRIYQILLVHKPRVNDAWQLPQGGIEKGETVEQTAIRELEEEVGLKLKDVKHSSETKYSYDFPPAFIARYKPVNHGQTLSFVAFIVDDSAKITVDNREVDNFAWVIPEQLPLYIKRKEYLEIIHKVLAECERHLQ